MDQTVVAREPPPSVRAWVSQLWTSSTNHGPGSRCEHVLPSGQMHLVMRLSGPALRLHACADDFRPRTIAGPVVGGARSRYYAKELKGSVLSVGAVLRPGAAMALFGVSAAELAEQHTPLCELWGSAADTLHARLAETDDPFDRMDLFAEQLAQRSRGARPVTPLVQHALAAMAKPNRIDTLVRASAISHRGFIAQFRQTTGLAPKQFARLMRFRQLLDALRGNPTHPLADLALASGYSDQAHMSREFKAMAGITARHYRTVTTPHASHVPLATTR